MNNQTCPLVRTWHRIGRHWIARAIVAIGAAGVLPIVACAQQEESATALTARSSIVVLGKVLRVNASLEPLQASSSQTIVITILRMYSGAEIAGDQRGHNATVVLDRQSPSLKVGTEAVFFGNPRFIGQSLTIAAEGELLSDASHAMPAQMESKVQERHDLPLRDRMASASSIFRGKVESERPLVADATAQHRAHELSNEHDPQWHVASVRVLGAFSGAKEGATVNVVFPSSRDIMWLNSPKLTQGQEAIFITHKPDTNDVRLMGDPDVADAIKKGSAEVVSEPLDVVPPSEEARVRGLLASGRSRP
jgi:hypothetical protein